MTRQTATLIRLILYSLAAGATWRALICFAIDYPNIDFHFYDRPIFWASTLVTAPIAFLMNRRRRMAWGDDWSWQRTKAYCSLFIPAILFAVTRFIPDKEGVFAWLVGMALFDSLSNFIGPEYPANPVVEWLVHMLLKRPRPEGVFAE